MLLSMTGFGEARSHTDSLTVAVEVRCINSRYVKISTRMTEGFAVLEARVESAVRKRVRRGTIQVNVRVDRLHAPDDYRVNAEVLKAYRSQLEAVARLLGSEETVRLESLLMLPGVVSEDADHDADAEQHWPAIEQTLSTALTQLDRMRSEEGRAMAADLRANCLAASASLAEVERRAPLVIENYRERLRERLSKSLAGHGVSIDVSELLREVSLFADRSDISEEMVRLRSHLEQFLATMEEPESSGRKLEFLTQEMVRESNTIGSKANDVEIARYVIEIKTAIERIREMIQNVE